MPKIQWTETKWINGVEVKLLSNGGTVYAFAIGLILFLAIPLVIAYFGK